MVHIFILRQNMSQYTTLEEATNKKEEQVAKINGLLFEKTDFVSCTVKFYGFELYS